MKKEDLRVGQIISFCHKEYIVLCLGKDYFFASRVVSKEETLIGYGSHDFANATLVKPKKKIYCSVWTQKSGYSWILSDTSYENYYKTVEYYRRNDHICIKFWELEYSEDERVT